MLLPALDARLRAAYDLVPACDCAADIGADHGRLSCALLGEGRCQRMIVSDVSAPSLRKARRLLETHGLAPRAEFRVADGLLALDHPVDAVCILGMGGRGAADILMRGAEKLRGAWLVLSAHSEAACLRRAVMDIGYAFTRETLARAAGRLYVVMQAGPGQANYTEKQLELGPCVLEGRDPLREEYLRARAAAYAAMRGQGERMLAWTAEELGALEEEIP